MRSSSQSRTGASWVPSSRDGTDGGAIYRLAVAPQQRRSGLGQALLRHAEDRLTALGASRLHAIVVESNENAVAFWDATDWEHQAGQLRFAK